MAFNSLKCLKSESLTRSLPSYLLNLLCLRRNKKPYIMYSHIFIKLTWFSWQLSCCKKAFEACELLFKFIHTILKYAICAELKRLNQSLINI